MLLCCSVQLVSAGTTTTRGFSDVTQGSKETATGGFGQNHPSVQASASQFLTQAGSVLQDCVTTNNV